MEITLEQFSDLEHINSNIEDALESLEEIFTNKELDLKMVSFQIGKLHSYLSRLQTDLFVVIDEIKYKNK
jgi:hypothetical protein